jgi:hypothetical protein
MKIKVVISFPLHNLKNIQNFKILKLLFQQFIGDTAKEKGYKFEFDAKDTGKKVAIIGGG